MEYPKLVTMIDITRVNSRNTKKILKPPRKGEMIKTYGCNKLIKKTLKFNKFTSLEDGIQKTLIWYKKFKNKDHLYFRKVKYK